jgi:hypothetical protein
MERDHMGDQNIHGMMLVILTRKFGLVQDRVQWNAFVIAALKFLVS